MTEADPEDRMTAGLVRGLSAGWLRRRAGAAAALESLETNEVSFAYESGSPPLHSRVNIRFLQAELLRATDRLDEALGWYGAFMEDHPYGIAYLAPAHLRRGEIYEHQHETSQAIYHYERFLALWRDCDPEFRPLVNDVDQRVLRLRAAG